MFIQGVTEKMNKNLANFVQKGFLQFFFYQLLLIWLMFCITRDESQV